MHCPRLKFLLPTARQHSLFRAFDNEQFLSLSGSARVHEMKAGDTLYLQEAEIDRFYLIIQGVVKLYRVSCDGREIVLNVFTDKECVGESEIFTDKHTHSTNAAIVENTTLLSFSSQAYKLLLQQSSACCYGVLVEIAARLQEKQNEIEALSQQSATDRVIRFLLSQVKDTDNKKDSVVIKLPLAKRLIAARLSMQPETFSRVITDFKRKGLMDVKGSQLNINCLADLRQMV